MEEDRNSNGMNGVFFITGAESTGKSSLTESLALHYGCPGVPEFARTYLESINRPYEYRDVEQITRGHMRLIEEYRKNQMVIFDSCLIILKVWFREVYGRIPDWLDEAIVRLGKGTYLLCEPDLPWEYDPLRENPHRREYLSGEYVRELEAAGFTYFRIFGAGEYRVQNAIEIIDRLIC